MFGWGKLILLGLKFIWKVGEKEPWCNIPDKAIALRLYKRRMWIEEMFGDTKKHGFDLESSINTFANYGGESCGLVG